MSRVEGGRGLGGGGDWDGRSQGISFHLATVEPGALRGKTLQTRRTCLADTWTSGEGM